MTNADLDNISISNDPRTNLGRVVDMKYFKFERKDKFLEINARVFILDVNGERLGKDSIAPPYLVSTYASNAWLVNPMTGEVVGTVESLTEEEQVGLMGEYDFFSLYAENAIELFPLLRSKIVAGGTLGRYNKP